MRQTQCVYCRQSKEYCIDIDNVYLQLLILPFDTANKRVFFIYVRFCRWRCQFDTKHSKHLLYCGRTAPWEKRNSICFAALRRFVDLKTEIVFSDWLASESVFTGWFVASDDCLTVEKSLSENPNYPKQFPAKSVQPWFDSCTDTWHFSRNVSPFIYTNVISLAK